MCVRVFCENVKLVGSQLKSPKTEFEIPRLVIPKTATGHRPKTEPSVLHADDILAYSPLYVNLPFLSQSSKWTLPNMFPAQILHAFLTFPNKQVQFITTSLISVP